MLEYVEIRIRLVENPNTVKEVIQRPQILQSSIWSQITSMVKMEPRNDEVNALLIDSINNMFGFQTRRVAAGLIDRIPGLIWIALFTLIIIAMFEVGYLLGGIEKPNWVLILALSMAFSAVIIIIVDLDSTKGTIVLNHQSMYDLHDRLIGK